MSMHRMLVALSALLAALFLIAGCSVDPMERLSEEIKSQDLNQRKEAILELANLDDPRATDSLIQVLDGDDKMGDAAGAALVKKGRERKTKQKPDPLLDAIAKVMGNLHTSQENRSRAAWVLGEIGDRLAIPALKGALTAKTAAGLDALLVRQAAQESLEKLGYDAKGRAYEIPVGSWAEPTGMQTLPNLKKIELPPPAKT